jgi:hypothetical protein
MAQFEYEFAKQENELWKAIIDCEAIRKLEEE